MIPHSFIQDLLSRVDIIEVVGRYVQLKKGGANFLGLCPFHHEKSPSFTVSPTKQFFHCFGCGAHGSAIGFLMEHAGISYVEAIQDLASSVGMVVPKEDRHGQATIEPLASPNTLMVMERACTYYRGQLKSAPHAIQYLKQRGLSGEIAAKFGLGYAPAGWRNLMAEFGAYEPSLLNSLLTAGLVIAKEGQEKANSQCYDRFRDRIIFPIRNTKGQVIAFGGRVLEKGEPKYLNSPETPLFSKGYELYGLFEARAAIRQKGYVLVTEGYMDVVALAQLGFDNAVATLGTACTSFHVQKMLRQTDRVVFAFDGDAAGRKAARRALEACLPHVSDNKNISFLFLPSEHDPDSFIRQEGAAVFAREVENALPLSQFLLKLAVQDVDLRQPEGRAQAQFVAKPWLQAMPAGALRLQIVHGLAELTVSSVSEVETVCALQASVSKRAVAAPARVKRLPPTALERQVLRLLLRFPELAATLDSTQRAALTQGTTIGVAAQGAQGEILADLLAYCDLGCGSFAALNERLADSPFVQIYASLRAEIIADEMGLEVARLELQGAISKLMLEAVKKEQTFLAQRIESNQATEDERVRYRMLIKQMRQPG